MDEPYFIEVDSNGCDKCGHSRTWIVVGPDECDNSVSFEDEDEAQRLADDLNAAYFQGHSQSEKRISELEAQLAAEKFTSEQLQRTIDSMAATEAKHAAEMSKCLRGMDEANEKLRERLTARNAQLKAAREALEIARQETRIAAVMLDQVEPSAAITVKESDRLHLAANKMRTVSDLSDKALAALDGEVKA